MRDKILLVYPKTGQDISISISPPHALLAIAAELNEDYQVVIIDQRIQKNWKYKIKKELKDNPICVGLTSMIGSQIKHSIEIANIIREIDDNIPIIWGGIHVSTLPEQSIIDNLVDIVVKHEGEMTFKELLPYLHEFNKGNFSNSVLSSLKRIKGICFTYRNKIYNMPDREFLDINSLKPTPWHLVNIEKYIHPEGLMNSENSSRKRFLDIGSTTRGCVRGCQFCYQTVYNKKIWRALSAEKTTKLFIDTALKYNLDGLWVRDDNFFLNSARTIKITEGLLESYKKEKINLKWYSSGIDIRSFNNLGSDNLKKLKKSGCNTFRMGIESGSNRILDYIGKKFTIEEVITANKWMSKNGFLPQYSFMGGFPTETINELMETMNLIDKLKVDHSGAQLHQLAIFNPIPGTPLFYEAIKYGYVPYNSLREYAEKSHFFSKNMNNFGHLNIDKNILNNISDMSFLISSYMPYSFPTLFRPLFSLLQKYYTHLWNKRKFTRRIDLSIYRKIRNKILEI